MCTVTIVGDGQLKQQNSTASLWPETLYDEVFSYGCFGKHSKEGQQKSLFTGVSLDQFLEAIKYDTYIL